MALFSFIFVLLVYFEQAKCAPHLQNWFTKAADETDNVQLFRGVQSKVNSLGECLFTSESDRKSLEKAAKKAQNAGATERQLLAVLNCVEKSLLANCEFRGDSIKVEDLYNLKQVRESGVSLNLFELHVLPEKRYKSHGKTLSKRTELLHNRYIIIS